MIDKTIDSIFSGGSSGSLIDNPLGLMLANFVAAGFDNRSSDQSKDVVIIPYNPVAGQLKAKGETDPTQGEKGYVSGYPLTSMYHLRNGTRLRYCALLGRSQSVAVRGDLLT